MCEYSSIQEIVPVRIIVVVNLWRRVNHEFSGLAISVVYGMYIIALY